MQQPNYQRIVSLAPNITEIIFFLGEQARLVGVTDNCDFPAEAKKLPKTGTFGGTSVERVVSLKPDLILSTDYKSHPSYQKMKSLGLNINDFETHSFTDAINLVQRIGDMLGVHDKAAAKTAELMRRVEEIRKRHASEKHRARIYVELWYSPVTTSGRGSFVSDMVNVLGAANVFDDIDKPYPQVSAESVIRRNPEIIFIGYMLQARNKDTYIKERTGWNGIDAVRTGRVYSDINPDLYLRPGPRLVDGLEEMEKRIYGKAVAN